MALKGAIVAECPKGCGPTEAEMWSYIRGDVDTALREALIAGDLNIVKCIECGQLFSPDATVVYYDPGEEFLAFIFPESYRKEEARWREKMHEDYKQMKGVLEEGAGAPSEPMLLFGLEEASKHLGQDQDLEDEVGVAEFLCPDLGLSIYPVARAYARERNLPRIIPSTVKGAKATREDLLSALMILLKANDRLEGFRRWLAVLGEEEGLPPKGVEVKKKKK